MFIRHNYLLLPVTSRKRVWAPSKDAPIHVVDGFVWNPLRERFEDVRGAKYHEIIASLGINQLIGFGAGGNNFQPVTNTYNSGAGNEAIPSGASNVMITLWGGGGGGGFATGGGGGGGGGGYCQKTSTVLSSEWGTNLAYSVGAGGTGETGLSASDATNGGNSTVTGTVGGGAISPAGNGGGATQTTTGGLGGTASGGDTNTSGAAGANGGGGTGGDGGASPNGGAGGVGGAGAGNDGTAPGGGGAGGVGDIGGNGAVGRISFAWT